VAREIQSSSAVEELRWLQHAESNLHGSCTSNTGLASQLLAKRIAAPVGIVKVEGFCCNLLCLNKCLVLCSHRNSI
jgi:hypothetical protein